MLARQIETKQQPEPIMQLMPLPFANRGEAVKVVELRAGERMRRRLAELGLHPGMTVRVISGGLDGKIILAVQNDARLAIGQGMAQKIMVRRIEGG